MRRAPLAALCALSVACGVEPYDGTPYPTRLPPLPAGAVALVPNLFGDTVSALDLAAGVETYEYPVGRDPLALDAPLRIVPSPDLGRAYLLLSYSVGGGIGPHAGHAPAGGRPGYVRVLSTTDLAPIDQVLLEPNPTDLRMTPDGVFLVVTQNDTEAVAMNPGDPDAARSRVAIVEASTAVGTEAASVRSVETCMGPEAVTLLPPDGRTAAIACFAEDAIALVDVEGAMLLARVAAGVGATPFAPVFGPRALAASPDGARLAVASALSGELRIYDVAEGGADFVAAHPVPGVPQEPLWSEDGAFVFVPTQSPDGVSVLDGASGAEIARREIALADCDKPRALAWRGPELLLVCEGPHGDAGKVLALDATTLATLVTFPAGFFPRSVTVLPEAG